MINIDISTGVNKFIIQAADLQLCHVMRSWFVLFRIGIRYSILLSSSTDNLHIDVRKWFQSKLNWITNRGAGGHSSQMKCGARGTPTLFQWNSKWIMFTWSCSHVLWHCQIVELYSMLITSSMPAANWVGRWTKWIKIECAFYCQQKHRPIVCIHGFNSMAWLIWF